MNRKIFLLAVTVCISFAGFGQKTSYDTQVKGYVDRFKEFAIQEQLRSGVPAAVTLAQGIVETAAGSSELCNNARNHFGIKCKNTWTGETYAYTDDAKDECFRKYETALISYRDHSDFLKNNKRYAGLFLLAPEDYTGWAHGLKKCGYATNPKYAQKLIEIIETYNLQDYTYAALGRAKSDPVILASAGPVARLQDGSVPENNVTVANVAQENNSWEVVRSDSPLEQETSNTSGEYYQPARKNGLRGFQARKGDMLLEYAIKNKVRYAKLLEMNDLPDAPLESDMFIYLEKKHKTAEQPTHIVKEGETLLQVSQEEGIQLEQLRLLNKLSPNEQPLPGSILNLKEWASEKPETYSANAPGKEEEVAFGYGARPAVGAGAGKADNWVETTKSPVREITDEPEDVESNIANLTAVEEEVPQAVAPVFQDNNKQSELDRLKAKMDQSVYGNTEQARQAEQPDNQPEEYEDPVTVPAHTQKQSGQSKDPDDALRKHMQEIRGENSGFTPKQNRDQSAKVKNMPVRETTGISSRAKAGKGKKAAVKKGKSSKVKAKPAGKIKKSSKSGAPKKASASKSKKTSAKKKR